MKKFTASIFLILIAAATTWAQVNKIPPQEVPKDYGYKVKIGDKPPGVNFVLANGETISSADLKGKVVMLQFTASWCSVCRKEMPHIEKKIWQKHKTNPDFVLIGVDMDEPVETVKKFAKSTGVTYPLALDPGADIFYTFAEKGAGVTRNIIIDQNGEIVYMTRLFKEEEFNEMVEVIDLLLESS